MPIKRLTATEHGLLGVVVHPDFASNKTVFFHASIGETAADKDQVIRATISDDNKITFDYANPIFKIESPEKHNGSMMLIHKGMLWMAIGDSGADATPPVTKYASCLNKPNGKILRMNLDGSAPADNPLSDVPMVTACTTANRTSGPFSMAPPEKRIWAWGLRQPYRFWIDPMTDLVWAGEVGEKQFDEIDIIGKGQHFGYPFEEGNRPYNGPYNSVGSCKGMTPSTECTRPAYQYAIGGGEGCIIGGFILDACGWPAEFKSRYLFGDFDAGRLFTVDVTPDRKGVVPNSRKTFGTFGTINGLRLEPDGAVYVTGFMANAVWRITPKNRPATCDTQPTPTPTDAGAPPSPDAATTGEGGTTGTGGSTASGGTTGSGGTPAGEGGATPEMGGKPGTKSGGRTGTNTGGTDDPNDPPAKEMPAGCGCTTIPTPATPAAFTALLLAALVLRRRR
jgi:MYXO-CTERM domain-containing protein